MTACEMSNTEPERENARQVWANSAATRSGFRSQIAAMTLAATDEIIRLGRAKPGMQILDVATGVGDPALTLAKLVGPDGHVTAVDMVNEMLEAAEEEARQQGLTNISFKEANAESLPFPEEAFDLVTCKHGVMFFGNVETGLREIHRVLKKGECAVITEDEQGRRSLQFQQGPILANLVLADEINRATPKTQSALLEAMQERTVTVGDITRELPSPFFVMATQNPIEMEGTYTLPEAQLDRFFFKVLVPFPDREDLSEILRRTIRYEPGHANPVADGPSLNGMIQMAREVPIASYLHDYAVALTLASHPEREEAPASVRQYIRYGASPRGLQALVIGGQVPALLEGRYNLAADDLQAVAYPALRHRLILNFEAQAEGVAADRIIDQILEAVEPKQA